jgi:secondary thiamine-phosphate synthase enzyme
MTTFSTVLTVTTGARTEISDITELVGDTVRTAPVSEGLALINTLHTTCALFVNEFQRALLEDLEDLLKRLVPERNGYRHDDPRVSDCERGNAHAHLRAALLGQGVAVGVNNGELALGQFQSLIFAELDGPRKREVSIRIIGAERPSGPRSHARRSGRARTAPPASGPLPVRGRPYGGDPHVGIAAAPCSSSACRQLVQVGSPLDVLRALHAQGRSR